MAITVTTEIDDTKGRFVASEHGTQLGEMTFSRAGDAMIIVDHTDVADAARGMGVGKVLFDAMVAHARTQDLTVMPLCPFAARMFAKQPHDADVLHGS